MQWHKLTDRMPNPEEHDRVLIYTQNVDFSGEQFFDVQTETLNECIYKDPEDQGPSSFRVETNIDNSAW